MVSSALYAIAKLYELPRIRALSHALPSVVVTGYTKLIVVCAGAAVSEPVADRTLFAPPLPAQSAVSLLWFLPPAKYWSCVLAVPPAYHVITILEPLPCCMVVPLAIQPSAIHPVVSASSWNSIAVLQLTSLNLKMPAVEP